MKKNANTTTKPQHTESVIMVVGDKKIIKRDESNYSSMLMVDGVLLCHCECDLPMADVVYAVASQLDSVNGLEEILKVDKPKDMIPKYGVEYISYKLGEIVYRGTVRETAYSLSKTVEEIKTENPAYKEYNTKLKEVAAFVAKVVEIKSRSITAEMSDYRHNVMKDRVSAIVSEIGCEDHANITDIRLMLLSALTDAYMLGTIGNQ